MTSKKILPWFPLEPHWWKPAGAFLLLWRSILWVSYVLYLSNADTSGRVRRWKLGGGDHHEERLEVSFLREKSQNQIQVIIMTYHFFLTRNLPRWRRWGADIQKQMWPSLNICYSCSVGWLPNEKESHFYALTSLGPYGVVQLSGY